MRNESAAPSKSAAPRKRSGCWAAGYPAPFDPHPIYLYGAFSPGRPSLGPGGPPDQALLGIREEPSAALPQPHRHPRPVRRARNSHRFMFGVAPEQGPIAPPEEPAFCFWDVGAG